ncbi:MAG: glyoxalase/bleomycin resistance/extradiol dioxygenase family protein [Mucilaginibacter sp.]|nr:glyoxalase/bleomycin resistance/extradiol dioxygenase family protein [Mucilaginibacter sp.]
MNLNHLNLSVQDVPAARIFFETYFDFKCDDSKPNDTLSVLSCANGFVLVLMNERLNENGNKTYPDAFHIGFFLDSQDHVITLFDKLKAGGVHLEQQPQKIRRTFGFYFHFQTVMIEIGSQVKSEQ